MGFFGLCPARAVGAVEGGVWRRVAERFCGSFGVGGRGGRVGTRAAAGAEVAVHAGRRARSLRGTQRSSGAALCSPDYLDTTHSIYIIKALLRSVLQQHRKSDRGAFQFYTDFLIKVSGKCVSRRLWRR